MNETNATPRQNYILNLVNKTSGIGREEIGKEASKNYKISKPTLIRDLNTLIIKKLIRTEGKGKNTKYYPFSKNPLFRPFELDQYFAIEPDSRTDAKKQFDYGVLNLKNLFTNYEIEKIKKVQKKFSEQEKILATDIMRRELERFVIELSWKSSKIEGNTYTLLETEALIKESKEAKGKSRDEAIMILNHKEAFEVILKNRGDFKQLSLSSITQLHNVMVKGLDITYGLRKQAVGITGTTYLPLDNEHQIREAMEKFVNVVNKNPAPLEKALISSLMLSYIQPFSDGNKRTARMLANAILLAYDYYPLSYRNIEEDEFKKSLIIFYEQGSLYHFKNIFIDQLLFAFNTYFK